MGEIDDARNAQIIGLHVSVKSKTKTSPFVNENPGPLSIIHSDGVSPMTTNPNGTGRV